MSFAAPLFLIAALAAAIPVILHLINRQQAKNLPFPTLRFLKLSAEKTRRRKRIHDLLLMLLRAAVLFLIALGLARPAITNLGSLWGGASASVAIVLDNSASMGETDGGRARFEIASAAVGQILDELHDGDQSAILVACGPDFPGLGKLDRTKDAVREILPQCKPSGERADLGSKIELARKILAKTNTPNKQIFVLSDLQKVNWEEKRNSLLPKGEGIDAIPLIFVECGGKPKPRVAVQNVEVNNAAPVAGVPIGASVELHNLLAVSWPCVAELYIDGAKEADSPTLSVPENGSVKHNFTFTCKSGGLHRGEVRLAGEDGSKFDGRRFFTLEVDRAIPVAIVKPKREEIPYLDDSYYLEKALSAGTSGGGAIHSTVLTAADLATEPLANFKAVFLVNLTAPNAEAAERLRTYVAGGGNLIWIGGDNVDCDAYNAMNEQAKGMLLPAALLDVRSPRPEDNRDSWSINFLDMRFPAFGSLTEPASLYQSVLVSKHIRMSAEQNSGAWTLARLDDGEPLFVERKSEAGSVFFLGTSVHVSWTNLPLRPIFLPLVSRLVFELAEVEKTHRSLLAGQPIEIQFAKTAEPLGVEVVPPSGEVVRLKTEPTSDKTGQQFRYAETFDTGIYLLRLLDAAKSTQFAYAVNVDPAESDPAKIDRAELEKLYAPAPLIFAENPENLSETFKTLREGKSLWGIFLTTVLIVLVFETYLSNWLGPRKIGNSAIKSVE
jgi:hypothetical protein